MNTTRRDESKKKFYAEVKDILEKKHQESSWYMMELMGVEGKEEADRKKAFRIMMNKLTEPYPASRPTMRRWFGINGMATPNRAQAYMISFCLGFSVQRLNHFLQEGIGQPAAQYNDYREVIFLYCLDHHYSYEQALKMIDGYEKSFQTQT